MKELMEKFTENVRKYPDKPLFFDETNIRGVSYQMLEEISSKVYAYLTDKGIGREDFVLINLPRGTQSLMAMVGVWKCGAAFTLVEDSYTPDRIDYIRKDCGCKEEINKDNWNEILHKEPEKGYNEVDLHNAAFAIYTSGTTGKPKGVLHEFGNVIRCVSAFDVDEGESIIKAGAHIALFAPLDFIAAIMFLVYILYHGADIDNLRMYIVSYATLKNPVSLRKFMREKTISFAFLTPSYIRMLKGQMGPYLKTLLVGSEPANNIFIKNVDIYNVYAMTESGFPICIFKIDKNYEICPIGKPTLNLKIAIVDDKGREVSDGEQGELCYDNPYFRGYINLPKETKSVVRGGLFHSGDIARKDSNDNYILLGRNNDMIKINGNRIEPAEIEAAVKEVLHIDWAAAKGFNEGSQSYICVYYRDNIEIDREKTREKLMRRLPYYMLPAYFLKIDNVPLLKSGKLDINALPTPDARNYISEYEAPTDDTEARLCDAMAKVLKLKRVGINDDFYEMGGDSLGAIDVVVRSELPGLNVSHIFRGRTAKNIAIIYEENYYGSGDGVPVVVKNEEAMNVPHFLTQEQLYMFDYQLYTPKSTMYNLFTMLKFDLDEFDMDRLADAVMKTIANHPALLTMYSFNEDGDVMQQYNRDLLEDIKVENISENEFLQLKDELVKPFKLTNTRLYRCRVFKTEKAGYVYFDVHHSLFDGSSFKIFKENIIKAYKGIPLAPDYYYYIIAEREKEKESEFYNEAKDYFENTYSRTSWTIRPETDRESRENQFGELISSLEITEKTMKELERSHKITRNEFFITAALLSIAFFNRKDNVKISWIYNGRDDTKSMESIGLLFRDLPAALKLNNNRSIRDLYVDVHNQVSEAIKYSCYPYVDIEADVGSNDAAYLLYQQDMRNVGNFGDMSLETIDIRQNQAASQTALDIEILDGEDGIKAMIDYASSRYKDETIEGFKNMFITVCHELAKNISQHDITVEELRNRVTSGDNIIKKFVSIFRRKV